MINHSFNVLMALAMVIWVLFLVLVFSTKLKKIRVLLIFVFIALEAYLIWNIKCVTLGEDVEIKQGQVWVYERNEENPFKKIERDTLVVLDTKSRYVKYLENGDTLSTTKRMFLIGSRLISQ